jgi:hypothetical protein
MSLFLVVYVTLFSTYTAGRQPANHHVVERDQSASSARAALAALRVGYRVT